MRQRLSITALFIATIALATSAWAELGAARIKVDFQHPVNVGEQTLPAGHYVFQQVHDNSNLPLFRVATQNGQNLTFTAIAVTGQVPQNNSSTYPPAASSSDVVLQKIGNTYYLDKIWVQGRSRGWAFDIPESANTQGASMQQEVVPGSYDENSQTVNRRNNQNNQATPENNHQANSQNAASTTSGEQSSASATQMKSANQVTSVSGCLQNGPSVGSYLIRDASSGTNVAVTPAPDLQLQMARQVGHTVRLIGDWQELNGSNGNAASMSGNSASNGSSSAMDAAPGGMANQNSAHEAFRVSRIDVISMQCSR